MKKFVLAALAITLVSTAGFAQAAPVASLSIKTDVSSSSLVLVDSRGRDKSRHWSRGQKLDRGHWNSRIRDYKRFGLRAPNRGHHWVKVGRQYLLINDRSGSIVSVMRVR
ncbi:RcnB family protein [Tianweitania sp. BSSL-BM11]|uniref:RcnB family protein n=1 Tax=Tianweitania aestuarii TaxID=2814886 RepID=A0ABS5S0L9_9HYPH|nr:RcnB family protein [Tianweitania aestuarii]MBS9721467.1 RcnB family protein [Tianweitania aestuarii]